MGAFLGTIIITLLQFDCSEYRIKGFDINILYDALHALHMYVQKLCNELGI